MSTEIETAKQEVLAYQAGLPKTVKNAAECEAAKASMIEVRAEMKRREVWFDEKILTPSHVVYQAAQKAWQGHKRVKEELLAPLKGWCESTDKNILTHIAKERAAAAELQRKADAAYAARIAKAEERGKDLGTVKPAPVYAPPTKTVKSEAGAYTVVERKETIVHDPAKIPEQYFDRILNMKRIDIDLRAGVEIPGATLQTVLGSAVRG